MFTNGDRILIKGCRSIGPAGDQIHFTDGEGTRITIDTATVLRLVSCWETDTKQSLMRSNSTRTLDSVIQGVLNRADGKE